MEITTLEPSANPPPASPVPGEPAMSESTCRECGRVIRYKPMPNKSPEWLRLTAPRVCLACTPILEARFAAEQAERDRLEAVERMESRSQEWTTICPPEYQHSDIHRIPGPFVQAVSSWQFGKRGLGLCAISGKCKTRAMLLLLQRLFVEEDRRCTYITSAMFSHRVSRLAGEKMDQFDEFITHLCRVPVLFLDDVGKGRMTDRVESELYHVVETRTAYQRPILFTANAGGNELAGMMSEDRGVPIVRRLVEFCDVVKL